MLNTRQLTPTKMHTQDIEGLGDAHPIVSIMWASHCCGAYYKDVDHDLTDEYLHFCEKCGNQCLITPAWAVRVPCKEHIEHAVPVPISLYMQDGQN